MSYRVINSILFSLFGFAFLSSCALTAPTSEQLIFRDTEAPQSTQSVFPESETGSKSNKAVWPFRRKKTPFYFIKTTMRPRVNGELEHAKDKFASYISQEFDKTNGLEKSDLYIRNPYYFSLAIPVSLIKKENIYWAFNIGYPVWGSDVTVPLGGDIYGTANLGWGDGEFILQKKVFQSRSMGLAIGGYYRTERRGFEIDGNELGPSLIFDPLFDLFSADKVFYNHMIGPRLNGFVSINSQSHIQFRLAPAYSLTIQKPMVNIGITIQLTPGQ